MKKSSVHITTIEIPLPLRARIDRLKATRALGTGKWPSTKSLVIEALRELMKRGGAK